MKKFRSTVKDSLRAPKDITIEPDRMKLEYRVRTLLFVYAHTPRERERENVCVLFVFAVYP